MSSQNIIVPVLFIWGLTMVLFPKTYWYARLWGKYWEFKNQDKLQPSVLGLLALRAFGILLIIFAIYIFIGAPGAIVKTS